MAGVRYSINNPYIYCDVNIKGFIHILQESVKNNVKHIVYASSSSVYGLNNKIPLGRIGQPKELAGIVVTLASNAGSYITGANFCLDGGFTCW